MEKSTIKDLRKFTDYQKESIVSKKVLEKNCGGITLFAFDKDQKLSEHSTPFDAFVQVIEGEGRIQINKKDYTLKEGECIIMPANISHAVYADSPFKMMLVMIKSTLDT